VKPELEKQVDKLRGPFSSFIKAQTTASAFLLLALFTALFIANSSYAHELVAIQHLSLRFGIGKYSFEWSLIHLVNDGLIALFFFLIGLEIKRELVAGELRDMARVGLLLSAAIGGMAVPAGLYLAINATFDGGMVNGWGIPMATDTAIAIGVLAALGSRIPKSVVAFLVGVAIIDDIGAILVIAFVYTEQLSWSSLVISGMLMLWLLILNRAGFRHPFVYAAIGVGLWAGIVQSGIHASIAGVIVAATVPARPRIEPATLKNEVKSAVTDMDTAADHREVLADQEFHHQVVEVERLAQEATTPLRRWEESLELPVMLLVLPLFAFLNAGVVINMSTLSGLLAEPVALGIMIGLLFGKPLGILAGVWLGIRLGFARRPDELGQRNLLGVGLLSGVGFTMSTFIAHLALDSESAMLESAKLAIVVVSAIAAITGYTVLRLWTEESRN
jgi:NhaA family Na+:H+ antiporter